MKNRFLWLQVSFCLLSIISCVRGPQVIPVTGITINPTSLSLVEGETAEIVATISPADADNQRIIWTSSDESMVSVTNGKVTAIRGIDSYIAYITAKTEDGGFIAECSVSVAVPRVVPKNLVYLVSYEEQDICIDISSNVSFTCSIDENDKSWISFVQTKALETQTLVFHVTSNDSYETRNAAIRATFGGIERDVVIGQGGKPIPFTDQALADFMVKKYDRNNDYRITSDEVDSVTELTINSRDIHSISGLQFLVNLKELWLNTKGGGDIPDIDLSGFRKLESLSCSHNNVSNLILSGATNLRQLSCGSNNLSELVLNGCPNLQSLSCENNVLKVLDLSNCLELKSLFCPNCGLNSLLLPSTDSGLYYLNCASNNLSDLDIDCFLELQYLNCGFNRLINLGNLNMPNLQVLFCHVNSITSINTNSLSKLQSLSCNQNPISTLDLHNLLWLRDISCGNCQIEELDLSECFNIESVNCTAIGEGAIELKAIYLPKDNNCNLYIPSGTTIIEADTGDDTIITNLDPYFKERLLTATIDTGDNSLNIDRNKDGEISVREAKYVTSIHCNSSLVKSLAGLEYFINLESVRIENNRSKVADFSSNTKLISIYYSGQDLESITFPNTPSLKIIELSGCPLSKIDVSKIENLERLVIGGTGIISLDVSKNVKLAYLWLDDNPLAELVMGSHPVLWGLTVSNCPLDRLDVSSFKKLSTLQGLNNSIKTIDLHDNTALNELRWDSPALETIYLFKDYYASIKYLRCSSGAIIIK